VPLSAAAVTQKTIFSFLLFVLFFFFNIAVLTMRNAIDVLRPTLLVLFLCSVLAYEGNAGASQVDLLDAKNRAEEAQEESSSPARCRRDGGGEWAKRNVWQDEVSASFQKRNYEYTILFFLASLLKIALGSSCGGTQRLSAH